MSSMHFLHLRRERPGLAEVNTEGGEMLVSIPDGKRLARDEARWKAAAEKAVEENGFVVREWRTKENGNLFALLDRAES